MSESTNRDLIVVSLEHAKMLQMLTTRVEHLYQMFEETRKSFEGRVKYLENLTDNLSADAFHYDP